MMTKININEHNYRPSWDEYFLIIVDSVSKRATCDRGKSGCVITKDNRILTTGYVGSPSKTQDCYEVGHLFRKNIGANDKISNHCIRTIHAEANAIAQAAKFGISLEGTTLYCTMEPCFNCAKLIVSSGITKVVCKFMYHNAQETRDLFNEMNIELKVFNKEILSYEYQ